MMEFRYDDGLLIIKELMIFQTCSSFYCPNFKHNLALIIKILNTCEFNIRMHGLILRSYQLEKFKTPIMQIRNGSENGMG